VAPSKDLSSALRRVFRESSTIDLGLEGDRRRQVERS
jgi:hypothetical protein